MSPAPVPYHPHMESPVVLESSALGPVMRCCYCGWTKPLPEAMSARAAAHLADTHTSDHGLIDVPPPPPR